MSAIKTIKQQYTDAVPGLQKDLGVANVMCVPRVEKVVVNTGIGKFIKNTEGIAEVEQAIKDITGQKPVFTKAKKSISGFKIREGQDVGMKVTLRGKRMWEFLDRLIVSALPRVRDFHGIDPKVIDASGNLNIGIKEHTIFPEIVAENVRHPFSFQVTVVSTAQNKDEAEKLYRALGFPLQK
ncbi:MAG: 50S ribosomal protein L5 [Candidatus Moraniibacteriota bacterium]|nr:MAG: 50S ribosomal protein L5 [Candidatus Moranbacteria bacterium]